MKKQLLLITLWLLSVTGLVAQTAIAPTVGDGTEGNPYEIANLDNLAWLSETSTEWVENKYFVQTADIDASTTVDWNDGLGFMPIGTNDYKFYGNYNGKGFTITGLTVNASLSTDYVGLFGYANGPAIIDSLGMISPNMTGDDYVGGLCGRAYYGVTISNCYSIDATIVAGDDKAGGLVGYFMKSFASNCYASNATVSGDQSVGCFTGYLRGTVNDCWSSGTATGRQFVGGFLGTGNVNKMTDCYTTANVIGTDDIATGNFVGGLCGQSKTDTVKNCYAVGSVTVTGLSEVGGLIGGVTACTIINCYYDYETSGQSDTVTVLGQAKTTVEMMQEATFANWDFVNTWSIEENTSYPTFIKIIANDVGISTIISPNTGANLSATETVTLKLMNYGAEAQSNIAWESYYEDINGDVQGLETGTAVGPIAAGDSVTFDLVGTANLSLGGEYIFTAATLLEGDEDSSNDTVIKMVANTIEITDVGMSALVSPNSGVMLSNLETVMVTITNFGTVSSTLIDWNISWDGPTGMDTLSGTVTDIVGPGNSVSIDAGTVDLSIVGDYIFTAFTYLFGDENSGNDTIMKMVTNTIPSSEAEILAFSFEEQISDAIIDSEERTISVDVITGADISALIASFEISDSAMVTVKDVEQISGTTANSFNFPVVYSVEAEDGTTKEWAVIVYLEVLSSEAEILAFSFVEQISDAIIDSETQTIKVDVTAGIDVSALIASFEISESAMITVGNVNQVSGTTANDFTNPVDYTVEAEDGTTKEWSVTVYSDVNVNESIQNTVQLYPNPATELVNISSDNLIESVIVYNSTGQEVFMKTVNNKLYRINTSNYDSGIYLLQIKTKEGSISKRIIIE